MSLPVRLWRRVVQALRDAPKPWATAGAWQPDGNNIAATRAALALLVIWFHCPVLLGRMSDTPPAHPFALSPMEQWHFVGGRVLAFFFLSGFLLTRSLDRSPRLLPFLTRRVARLYPAFLVCAALCGFVLLPLLSSAKLPAWQNVAVCWLTFRVPPAPGVFPRNPVDDTLNGSLWTLLYEAWCVVLLATLAATGAIRRGYPLAFCLCAAIIVYTAQWFGAPWFPLPLENDATWTLFGSIEAYPRLLSAFFAGATLYRYRAHLPWHPALFWASLAALLLATIFRVVGLALPLFGGYALLYIVFHPEHRAPRPLSRLGDLSYGIFLYGYPVQQVGIHALGTRLHPALLFALTVPVAVLLAYFSHRFIERFAEAGSNTASRKP